ncbi:MAG: YceI family protein [Saprospiraceae bacterium]|nr:YceI family protein [Saprospiraceae bacterium]
MGKVSDLTFILVSCGLCMCWGCLGDQAKASAGSLSEVIEEDLSKESPVRFIEIHREGLPSTKYQSDSDHSSISFQTGHWEIVNLIGWFESFQVVMYSDSFDFSDAVIYAQVDPTSIRMPNVKMSGTASKAPYIDSEAYPMVTFESREIKPVGDDQFIVLGIFGMNGVEKLVEFIARFQGFAYPGEKSICGFHAFGKIDRNDFSIGGDDRLHSGKAVHSDTIELRLDLRME